MVVNSASVSPLTANSFHVQITQRKSLFEGEVSDTHMRSTVKSEGTDPVTTFFRKTRPFHLVLGVALITILLAACGNSGTTSATPTPTGSTTAAPVGGKGCTKVGVLLPEIARWDSQDRPLLIQKIQAIAGVTIDYYNAQGDAVQQQSQADTALSKGDCILVVAPQDAIQAASIVAKAQARKVPVIAYDRRSSQRTSTSTSPSCSDGRSTAG